LGLTLTLTEAIAYHDPSISARTLSKLQVFQLINIQPGATMSPSIATTKSLDHLVLTVQDLDATVKFYQEVMGMTAESFASATTPDIKRHALKFGTQKINLHVKGKEFEPKAQVGSPLIA
jgi:4-hydroxyphenylpyruvate dioxygenase-like putative hemolysin